MGAARPTINRSAKRHRYRGTEPARSEPQASAAQAGDLLGGRAPQPENGEFLSAICDYTHQEVFPPPNSTTPRVKGKKKEKAQNWNTLFVSILN